MNYSGLSIFSWTVPLLGLAPWTSYWTLCKIDYLERVWTLNASTMYGKRSGTVSYNSIWGCCASLSAPKTKVAAAALPATSLYLLSFSLEFLAAAQQVFHLPGRKTKKQQQQKNCSTEYRTRTPPQSLTRRERVAPKATKIKLELYLDIGRNFLLELRIGCLSTSLTLVCAAKPKCIPPLFFYWIFLNK